MLLGRMRGLEPPNGGTTSRCRNHLATLAMSLGTIAQGRDFGNALSNLFVDGVGGCP